MVNWGDMGPVFPGVCVAEEAPSQRLEAPDLGISHSGSWYMLVKKKELGGGFMWFQVHYDSHY